MILIVIYGRVDFVLEVIESLQAPQCSLHQDQLNCGIPSFSVAACAHSLFHIMQHPRTVAH